MSEFAILVNGEIVPATLPEWGEWFSNIDHRRVAETYVGAVRISTVFLGLNHAFSPTAPPLWFETMIFGGELDQEQVRYSTLEEAKQGHDAMVAEVRLKEGKYGDE